MDTSEHCRRAQRGRIRLSRAEYPWRFRARPTGRIPLSSRAKHLPPRATCLRWINKRYRPWSARTAMGSTGWHARVQPNHISRHSFLGSTKPSRCLKLSSSLYNKHCYVPQSPFTWCLPWCHGLSLNKSGFPVQCVSVCFLDHCH